MVSPRPRLVGAAAALGAALLALWQARQAGVAGPAAAPDVLRGALAAVAIFAACGYAPARALTPARARAHLPLLVLPVGAVTSALALTVLAFLRVPFDTSFPIVLALGVLSSLGTLLAHRRERGEPVDLSAAGGLTRRILWPFYIAALVAALALVPVFRTGVATVIGQNGDAVLAVGSVDLVKQAPPTAVRPALGVDRVPLVWRSKYPIFYSLAGVSKLSGLRALDTFATLSALLLGMAALGFFLFAYYALRAGPTVSLLAMGLVALDRIVMHVTVHPYYNQLWGLFALPFILLTGWWYLREPGRRSLGLFLLFAALGAFAYPLMLPFPVLFLGIYARRRWLDARSQGAAPGWVSALRLPRTRRSLWVWVPVVLVALRVTYELGRGVTEKLASAAAVQLPWKDLGGWSGTALGYLPFPRFLGVYGPYVVAWAGALLLIGVAWLALRRLEQGKPDRARVARSLFWTLFAALMFAGYFRARQKAQLFYFKDLGFAGPLLVMLAAIGLADLARRSGALRAAGVGGLVGALVVFSLNTRRELTTTFDQASPAVRELASWSRSLPPGRSVRIDVPPGGYQLWADYMLADRPVSALHPLSGFFPHPPRGRKADFVLIKLPQRKPSDAAGAVLRSNLQFRLYRLRADIPGPDRSSRRMIQPIKKITID